MRLNVGYAAPFLQALTSTFTPVLAAASADSISGQYLLGSSFGVPGINTTFTHVIVGGGTAGLVLANRLSASPATRVAVIEAGSFYELSNGNVSQIPRYASNGAGTSFQDVNPLVDWMFSTVPQRGIGNSTGHYSRGRTLGGTSARNHMSYQIGSKGSYDKWAETVGDDAFRWDNFKRFFDKSTTFHEADRTKRPADTRPEVDPAGKAATEGPVSIAYSNYPVPMTSWIFKGLKEVGLRYLPGFIGGELIGFGWFLRTQDPKSQTRESSETAYLRPALKRNSLVVYQLTMATRILFDDNKNAIGVQCDTFGKQFQIMATKQVIISAGALQSPQLLMLSGIGPKETLIKHGVPVLVDSPGVGHGMHEHVAVGVTHRVTVESSTTLNTSAKTEAATREFVENASGPLTSAGGDLVGFEKVPRRLLSERARIFLDTFPSDWPDIEYLVGGFYPGIGPADADYASLSAVLISTSSRGTVTISSASIFDQPVIDVAVLTSEIDQDYAVAAFKRLREIFATKALSPILVGPEIRPGNGTMTDAQILKYIQSSAGATCHASCTCKMGKSNDSMAVVDSSGRVFGVKRLRVVDAAAMPFLVPGHPMATIYALAEKIAEDILED